MSEIEENRYVMKAIVKGFPEFPEVQGKFGSFNEFRLFVAAKFRDSFIYRDACGTLYVIGFLK